MQHPSPPVNAYGDIILQHDDESSRSNNDDDDVPSPEMEDIDASDISTDHQKGSNSSQNNDQQTMVESSIINDPCTILEHESFNVPTFSDDKDIPQLRIMQLVRKYGAPLKMVGEIAQILKDESKQGRLDVTKLTTHQTGIRRLQKMYNSLPSPIPVTITHERTIQEIKTGADRPSLTFPTFSFLGQFQDLLNDHVFSDLQNLVVDPSNRWDHYKKDSCPHSTEELQDGDWFQSVVQNVHSNPPPPGVKDFIFGIQGYVDKTGTDAYQRRAVEPFVFTLTLFSNKIRNSSKYWRLLALLPASTNQRQKKRYVFGASVRNYHLALKAAFEEFIQLQQKPPMVRVRLGDQFLWVRARLFWINTIADGLANDQLVGRIQNRTTSPRLSRGCHCPQHMADECMHLCKFPTQSAIECLVVAALGPSSESQDWVNFLSSLGTSQARRAADSSLQTRKQIAQSILKQVFGQHVVDLVWFHIDQGPNPRGCFGSTPVDPMHAFEEGIVPNILSVILDPLSDSVKSHLDSIALSIVSSNRWDKEYPRMNFSGGFSSLTQLTADEKVGKMLLLWIIMQTPIGKDIMSKRCSSTFDAQRTAVATRFTGQPIGNSDDSEVTEEEEDDESPSCGNSMKYTGSQTQMAMVVNWLHYHRLQYVVPWMSEMIPYHQELLRKTVYNICSPKGQGGNKQLPDEKFLDRYPVNKDSIPLYCMDNVRMEATQSQQYYKQGKSAEHSLDCSVEELQKLLEMLLAFHATYKYGNAKDKRNFDHTTRLMMSMVKGMIQRGADTKNWSISKFHELLHFHIDHQNFGSQANIDAGKGEHGLKLWAKLPSKNVRARPADIYYMDLAQRIYENRLLELASATLLPRAPPNIPPPNSEDGTDAIVEQQEEVGVKIELSQPLLQLTIEGTTSLRQDVASFLRRQSTIAFPIQIYQEAKYSRDGDYLRTVRASPNYRSTGPWYDWVYVCYEIEDEQVFYPYQVLGCYENTLGQKTAVGRMGQRLKASDSSLLDHWTLEAQMRLVDMETIWQVVFAISIPTCCLPDRTGTREVFVIKDRIQEWPSVFATKEWVKVTKSKKAKRKRHL
jgi:hypothetical protein